MRLKLSIFSLLTMLAMGLAQAQDRPSISAEDSLRIVTQALTAHEQRVARAQQRWMSLIPSLGCIQYAGNIGLISAGFGWDYGKRDRWETLMQVGFVPRFEAEKANMTFTLRENLLPWSIGLGSRRMAQPATATGTGSQTPLDWNRRSIASFEPFVFSMALNTIFNNEFWVREPEKYNGGDYYRFSSKVRLHLGIGSRLSLNIPKEHRRHSDRISLYYELSTYDLAIISAIPNEKITLGDILCLGMGMQYKFF